MEKINIQQEINKLYNETLNRDIDEPSLEYLTDLVITKKQTIQDIKNNILNSPEYELVNPYAKLIKEPEPPRLNCNNHNL